MNIIDRYLHEVGRFLPRKNREDILAEIRSHLSDTLEARVQGNASEEDMIALLKETGSPRELASSYPDCRQYLIGPDLYPFFQMVAGIVLAAVIGAQLLAFGVTYWMGEEIGSYWEALGGILTSIPAALGSVVIVFMILQHFGVQAKLDDEQWDPRSLPIIDENEVIKKGERIFGIAAGSILIALLAVFQDKIGVYLFPGGAFYPNPVLMQYLGWIILSLLASIGLDIFLLWQGRWTLGSRIARIAVNGFSIAVLILLLQGHNAWLAANGSGGFFESITGMATSNTDNFQVFTMEAFRMAFGVALIVTIIETCVLLFKPVRNNFKRNRSLYAMNDKA
jgi:hypothetical protein